VGVAGTASGAGGTLATVNGKAITQSDFERNLNRLKSNYRQRGGKLNEAVESQMKDQALETLINEELLYQESRKAGIQVPQAEIDRQMAMFKEQFPDDATYQTKMKELNLTGAALKQQIRKGLAIQSYLQDRVIDKIQVTEDETRQFYDNNPKMFATPETIRASHILIKVDASADELQKMAARKQMAEIKQKLNSGADFADLARQFSEGPSKERGGDLGYFQKGQMVPPFEKAAFALKVDQVSDMVLTTYGYHLIKVTDRKPSRTVSYPEASPKISKHLKQEKVGKQVMRYIESLKRNADIKIL
jgi:peptidyl-prolyl cis-trans isomerase C